MPIYEYECTKCGKIHEEWQKITDKPLTKCSTCSGKLQKLISRSAFHLKGSGWYVTDYGAKHNPGSSPQTESSAGNATDKSADKGSTAAPKTADSNTDS
ncbi:MAG: zinc ribbon domain-containing protein [Thermodesulfobacteriota bacterium]|nr:zinc ribbon domain-containing protein [Thermodesulfobacteriota bacterium]